MGPVQMRPPGIGSPGLLTDYLISQDFCYTCRWRRTRVHVQRMTYFWILMLTSETHRVVLLIAKNLIRTIDNLCHNMINAAIHPDKFLGSEFHNRYANVCIKAIPIPKHTFWQTNLSILTPGPRAISKKM